jgi:Zn-dependent metalloprotease
MYAYAYGVWHLHTSNINKTYGGSIMKRFIFLAFLSLILFSSCESPMSEISNSEELQNPGQIASQITPNTPPEQADSIRKAIWQQFKKDNGQGWRIRWNKTTGLPASIFSGLTQKAYPGNAEQAARAFLKEHGTLFGVADLTDLDYIKTQTHKGIRHVTFNQSVNDVPVYEAEYKVHLRQDGRVDMANGTYYPNLDISTSPGISESEAADAAISDLEVSPDNLDASAELVIYRDGDQFRLAWKLILFSPDPLVDWFYIVDARTGEILYKLNQLTDVTGIGDAYPTSPCLSSVGSQDLYGLLGNGYLDGTYVEVFNSSVSRAFSSSHSFVYSTSNTHFDEVSLYYNVDNFRRNFVENLDASNTLFTKLNAYAHNNSVCPDNACFSPSTRNIYFSDTYEYAKEDKVVHHEYGHAVIFDIQSGIASEHNEEGAISEGTPDYFTGSFTNRSQIGDCAVPFAQRDMANPNISHYDEYLAESPGAHRGGEFFSAILWDLYNSVNPDNVDFLVYDALFRITGDPDFFEFRDAMIAASNAAYGGLLNSAIQDAFGNRGVGEPDTPTEFTVSINGPQSTYLGEEATWTVDIYEGTAPYSYSWQKRAEGETYFFIVGTGSSYSETIDSTTDFELKVIVTDAQNMSAEDLIQVTVNDQIPAF